ncbi:MAG: 2-dehydro-3-deoxy-6-phosphogalactonate aldolase [Rhizobiaceae bacterium]|nr:2-dehydro-3-deoxy-6-phosphogalactonate aldolase [Rhizobiaceae bacterium]
MSRNLIAILRGVKPEEVLEICRGLVEIGFTKIEVPLNSPNAYESISILSKNLPDTIMIGAGTVLTAEQVDEVKAAGGRLIVSPDCNTSVIDRTVEHGMESWPGVATATEAFTALRHGATGLKLFPGIALKPEGLGALKAVLPKDVAVYPVGGAGPSNFAEWVKAGAEGFGIGSALYKPGLTAEEVKARGQDIIDAYDAVF